MPPATPPPVTVVIDRHDDALYTHTALAAHHLPSGRITLHPGPGTTSETGLAHDLLAALGKPSLLPGRCRRLAAGRGGGAGRCAAGTGVAQAPGCTVMRRCIPGWFAGPGAQRPHRGRPGVGRTLRAGPPAPEAFRVH